MRIGELSRRLGTTPHTIRWYERQGVLKAPARQDNGYREYSEDDLCQLRLVIGLRSLDIPLAEAASLAGHCASGRCDVVSDELKTLIPHKRTELARRVDELRFLDERLASLAQQLDNGRPFGPLISIGKEVRRAS